MFSPVQFSQASQSLIETHFRSVQAVTQAWLSSSASLAELHLDTVKTSLAASTVASNQLLALKGPQDWLSLASCHSQQAIDRAQAYGRQAAGVASNAHALLSEAGAQLPLNGLFFKNALGAGSAANN
ncbi:MAG: phasin family protein [Pseudomonadota bacterium]